MTRPDTPPRSGLRLGRRWRRRRISLALDAIRHDPHLARDIGLPADTPTLPSRTSLW